MRSDARSSSTRSIQAAEDIAVASGNALKRQFQHINHLVEALAKKHVKELRDAARAFDKKLGLADAAGLDAVAVYVAATLSMCHPGTLEALAKLKLGWLAASHAHLRQFQAEHQLSDDDLENLVCLKLLHVHLRGSKIAYVRTVAQGLAVVQLNKAARYVLGRPADSHLGGRACGGPLDSLFNALRAHMRTGWEPAKKPATIRKKTTNQVVDTNYGDIGTSVSQAIDVLAPYSRKLQGVKAAREALSRGTHAALQLSDAVQSTSDIIADILEIPKADGVARRNALQIAFLLGIYLRTHKTYRSHELVASLPAAARHAFASSKVHMGLVETVFPDGHRFPWSIINAHAIRVYRHMSKGGNLVSGLLAKLQGGLANLFRAHKLFSFVSFVAGSVMWGAGKTMALVGLATAPGKSSIAMMDQFLTSSSLYLVAAIAFTSLLGGVANEARLAGMLVDYDQGSFEIMLQKAAGQVRALQMNSSTYLDSLRYNITNANVNTAVNAAVRCAKYPGGNDCPSD